MKLFTFTFVGLVFALLCGNVDAFAQAKWLPIEVDIEVSSLVTHSISKLCNTFSDSSWQEEQTIWWGITNGTLTNYTRSGDSISIGWSSGYSMVFDLDSLNNKLKNFSMNFEGYSPPLPFGYERATIILTPISFIFSGDTMLIVDIQASKLFKQYNKCKL